MNSKVVFCGECGKPLQDGAGFCGECGTAAARPVQQEQKPRKLRVKPPTPNRQSHAFSQSETPAPVSTAPPEVTSRSESFSPLKAPFSILQWMIIWLVSWIPVGLSFAGLYLFSGQYIEDTIDAAAENFLISAIGSGVGGFLAGLAIYLTLRPKQSTIGFPGFVPGFVGALIWTIGLLPLLLVFWDDDAMVMALPVLAILYGVLVSRLSITQLETKYNFATTTREKNLVAVWWVLCSLLGVSVLIAYWAHLW